MENSRVKNTKRNISWSFVDYTISALFQFVSRTIIVYFLGQEYLGLSSLFSSILSVLNMTELGFSSAIIYNLYKPIADHDTDTVCALLAFYKKIYRIVGLIILVFGSIISPFLRMLIKSDVPLNINIYLLYYLYLTNTSISYFVFAYKASLLNAVQRLDLTKIAYSIINIAQCGLQILVLVLFKNYYLFVVVTILGTALKNILAAFFANKYYPEYISRGKISQALKKDIWHRVKGLLVANISGVTYTTFDSIILSAMIGLIPVALYNNYYVIYGAITGIIVLIRHAMQASVGNSVAIETVEKNYRDVFVWQFAFSAIGVFCSCCLLCLYQPFMTMWMGEDALLPFGSVILISILCSVSTVQHSFYLYLSANGLWWELRWPYMLSTIANIAMNIVFCQIWGITGIILATVVAQFVFGLIWQSKIIFKEYFKKPIGKYYLKQSLYFAVGVIDSCVAYILCDQLNTQGIVGLILRLLICTFITVVCFLIFFGKTIEFQQSKKLVFQALKR